MFENDGTRLRRSRLFRRPHKATAFPRMQDLFRLPSDWATPNSVEVASFFVFVSPTEPECNIPTRSTETNNEITRAGLWQRHDRDFGGKSAESGRGRPPVDVSRDTGGEREPCRA